MYYNKNLFVHEQIKKQVMRLEKKQLIALICIVVSALVLYIGGFILLVVFLGTDFPIGYVIPALGAILFAVLFAVIVPIIKRIDKLRLLQTEQLKPTVYGEKYAALFQAGKKCQKLSYCLIIPSVAFSLILSLVLAIIFPYELYYSYLGFILPLFLMCIITLIVLNRSRKEIRNMEIDLVDFFAKQYEIEAAKAQEKANADSANPTPQQQG